MSHVHGSNLPPTEAEVKGSLSERVRDNSIKVLVSEKRSRRLQETLRSTQRNTHQHFLLSRSGWHRILHNQTGIQTRSCRAFKPAEGKQEAGSTKKQEVTLRRGGHL